MRHLLSIMLLAVVCACSGCMYCENGLCSAGEQEAVFDTALLGEWIPVEPKPEMGQKGYFQVVRDAPASKAYRITAVTTADTKQAIAPYTFKAYLIKLGDFWFLEAVLSPDPDSGRGSLRHTIWRVDIKMPEMTVRPLSERFVKAHPDALPRTLTRSPLGMELTTVTATVRELGDFVRKQATNDEAWEKPGGRLRHR